MTLSERIDSAIAEFGHAKVLRHILNTNPEKAYIQVQNHKDSLPESEPITDSESLVLRQITSGRDVTLCPSLRTSVPVNYRSIAEVTLGGTKYHIVRKSW